VGVSFTKILQVYSVDPLSSIAAGDAPYQLSGCPLSRFFLKRAKFASWECLRSIKDTQVEAARYAATVGGFPTTE